jgi:hypothetical protein
MRKKLGMEYGDITPHSKRIDRIKYINFKLASLGLPYYFDRDKNSEEDERFLELFDDIIMDYKEKLRLINKDKIGIHKRINEFFKNYFQEEIKVEKNYLTLDHYGVARELSLPVDGDEFSNEYMKSYRVKQGVLHNPKNDRRTTKGSFQIVEGGLDIPSFKKVVPKNVFVNLYKEALKPPEELKVLPYTAGKKEEAKIFVSLLIKPLVSPKVPSIADQKMMEVFFLAPGSLVSNLDFVESVFGNAGDPSYHLNDLGLDVKCWTGTTGYIVLAPHLTKLKKADLGLPHFDNATEKQREDGMCYKDESELYNGGQPFKLTCRDKSGVAVTLIADSYFGYSKKEIKTLISFSANMYGNVEEEHAGGTIVYPRYGLGEYYKGEKNIDPLEYNFEEVKSKYASLMDIQEENYGIDKNNAKIIYLPENAIIDLHKSNITWDYKEKERKLRLQPTYTYILPSGYKIHIERHGGAPIWKLVGTNPEGIFCHKPCTVSGGGKSEISKSIGGSIVYGSYYVNDLNEDLNYVERILHYDYSKRWKKETGYKARKILSRDRTLGSVIKLLTPSSSYNDEYNRYIEEIPNHVKALVFLVKRFYNKSWGDDWRKHFSVDMINGQPGNEIKYRNRAIKPSYLRVGFTEDGAWRVFKLRMDFFPSEKIHTEDDISVSTMIPKERLSHLCGSYTKDSYKFVQNCEYRFFQRPDEAIYKGFDKKAEADLSAENVFVTNYEALNKDQVEDIRSNLIEFISYSDPVKKHIDEFLESEYKYCVVSSEPRIVEGKPTKNPRYLEYRPDFVNPLKNYIAEVGTRLARKIPADEPIITPVSSILPGRRNNPPALENGKKILPLSVYAPIHYQELPELFMDFISSLTGKSPSTTGAGSEGALTKAPFNMLLPIYDLNSSLLSFILGGYEAFTTPAGHIGSKIEVEHDISMLIPELWSRLSEKERSSEYLIKNGLLEKIDDFEYNGETILASRLGYRITGKFLYSFFGKIFDEPKTIFTEDILKPEIQSKEAFADGVRNITSGHKRVALSYFEDGGINYAIEPLKALLNIMAYGEYEGHTIDSEEVRKMFTKDYVLQSDWYKKRLDHKQKIDINLAKKFIHNLEEFIERPVNQSVNQEFNYEQRLEEAKNSLEYYQSDEYRKSLIGTTGAENMSLS